MPDPLYPLTDLVTSTLPPQLNISEFIPGFLNDIKYKNHKVSKSTSGHEAYHELTLVINDPISLTIPGIDVKLLFTSSNLPTEIDVKIHYVWNVIKFIHAFNISTIPNDLKALLDSLTQVYNDLDIKGVLQKLIEYYNDAEDAFTIPLQSVVAELNRHYGYEISFLVSSFDELKDELENKGTTLQNVIDDFQLEGITDPSSAEEVLKAIIIAVPIKAIVAELNGHYGYTIPLSISSFDELKDELENKGKTLQNVIDDFHLEGITDPSSAEEVLGAVVKKGIYILVKKLNEKYTLTDVTYTPTLDLDELETKLNSIGCNVADLLKGIFTEVVDDTNVLKDKVEFFLKNHIPDTTDVPASIEELFIPHIEVNMTNVNMAVEFPRSMLIPLNDDGSFMNEPATSKLTFNTSEVKFITSNGFDLESTTTCELKRSSIMETGVTIQIDESAISEGEINGKLTFPYFTDPDTGEVAGITIKMLIKSTGFELTATDISPLTFFGLTIDLEDINIKFNSLGLDNMGLSGTLSIPGFTVQEDIKFTIVFNGHCLLEVSNFPELEIAGIKLVPDENFSFDLSMSDSKFSLGGKLYFPGVDDGSGSPVAIGIKLAMDNGNYKIIASSPSLPPLYLGGLEITLTGLEIGFNKDGIIPSDTSITGTINIPAFDVELEIKILLADDGFTITAEVPEGSDYINVLDIEDLINVQLSMLSIGKNGSNWSFRFGGKIINHIVVPGIEKFVPKEIDINNFDLSPDINNLPDTKVDVDIDLIWPNDFKIEHIGKGNYSSSFTVSVDMSFGDVMYIRAVQVDIEKGDTTTIDALLLGTKFSLGPVTCTIEGMGLGADIELGGTNSNLGPVNVDMHLIYPKGIGISLESDVFTGGGYLFFDHDNNRYAGAIELSIKDMFSFTAIGLLTTVLPDGSKGTSLLIIITAEFPVPIPLSYNFYLSGVGGLIGIHRTVNVDKLGQGVTTGAIANILFPKNVISNISQIVSNLRAIFPPKRDQFLIGPMAMITWNTPPVLTIELGLMIEFTDPVRIFILGIIKTALPTEDHALVSIKVAFVGVIDFEKGMISFDAGLFDSKIVSFTLEGQMALRLSWGANPDFAVAVGGFHPAYKPAPHLHFFKMKRLTINFLTGNPRLTLTTYFALTTNSVQFGAAIDFYMSLSMFKIVGGFGFDVLFIFDPFHFIAQVSAGLAVKCGGSTLFSIALRFTLTGPNPWVASGKATFKILFIKYTAKFSKTIGEEKHITLPDVDVLPLVIKALNDSNNWKSELSDDHFDLVTLRKDTELAEGEVLLAAFGTLSVSQKIVPLGITISRFGHSNPAGVKRFEISNIGLSNSGGTTLLETEKVTEDFVPAAYKDMTDDDKLSSPSFEKLQGGFRTVGTDMPESQWGVNKEVEYELILSDTERLNLNPVDSGITCYGVRQSTVKIPDYMFDHFAKGGAVRNSVLSGKNRVRKFKNEKSVTLGSEHYVIAGKNDLKINDTLNFNKGSKAEADEALMNALKADPSLKDELIIIPDYKAVLQD